MTCILFFHFLEASLSGGEAILGLISAVFLIILLCSGGAVCKTTGNCLSAPTQCPRWDNRRYRAPNVRTELDEIADTSEHPPASPSESMIMEHQPASSSESIIMEHPPSYNSLTGICQKLFTWQLCPPFPGETVCFRSIRLFLSITKEIYF